MAQWAGKATVLRVLIGILATKGHELRMVFAGEPPIEVMIAATINAANACL